MSTRLKRYAGAAAIVVILLAALMGTPGLRWLDQNLLNESLKDGWGRWWHEEDWQEASELPRDLDYSWLRQAGQPVLIAHALGEAGKPGQNTLAAMRRSLASGLRLLEVDLWLDKQGLLRCHHGPDVPGPFQAGDCTLPSALGLAASNQAWLVLDIKTDFRITGEAIVKHIAGDPSAAWLVFQLYRPGDMKLFADWSSQAPLPGPIVTAYLARRSVRHVARHAARIGARVLTIPLPRAAALGAVATPLTLLVHPVHDCEAVKHAMALGAGGLYVGSALAPEARRGCLP